jgi:hypothetical protein
MTKVKVNFPIILNIVPRLEFFFYGRASATAPISVISDKEKKQFLKISVFTESWSRQTHAKADRLGKAYKRSFVETPRKNKFGQSKHKCVIKTNIKHLFKGVD